MSRGDFQFTREPYQRFRNQDYATLNIERIELRSTKYPLATTLMMYVIEDTFRFSIYPPDRNHESSFNQFIQEFTGSCDSLDEFKNLLITLFNTDLAERTRIINEALDKKREEERIEQEKTILTKMVRSRSQQWATTNLPSLAEDLNRIQNIKLLPVYTIISTAREALEMEMFSDKWYQTSTDRRMATQMRQVLERLALLS